MIKKIALFLLLSSTSFQYIHSQDAFQDHTDIYREAGTFEGTVEKSGEDNSDPEANLEEPVEENGEFDTFYRRHGTFDSPAWNV